MLTSSAGGVTQVTCPLLQRAHSVLVASTTLGTFTEVTVTVQLHGAASLEVGALVGLDDSCLDEPAKIWLELVVLVQRLQVVTVAVLVKVTTSLSLGGPFVATKIQISDRNKTQIFMNYLEIEVARRRIKLCVRINTTISDSIGC